MYKLYWQIETENGETFKRLIVVPESRTLFNHVYLKSKLEFVETDLENVTVDELLDLFGNELEGANYHRQVDTMEQIMGIVRRHTGEDVARLILLDLIKEYGTVELFGG